MLIGDVDGEMIGIAAVILGFDLEGVLAGLAVLQEQFQLTFFAQGHGSAAAGLVAGYGGDTDILTFGADEGHGVVQYSAIQLVIIDSFCGLASGVLTDHLPGHSRAVFLDGVIHLEGNVGSIVNDDFKVYPLALHHGTDHHMVGVGGSTLCHAHGERSTFIQIAAAAGFRGIGNTQDAAIGPIRTCQHQLIGNGTGRKLVVLDPQGGLVTGFTGLGSLGDALLHPLKFQLHVQGFLIVQLVAVEDLPACRLDGEGQVVTFSIRAGFGVHNEGSVILGKVTGLQSGTGSILCADDLGILRKRSAQLYRISKHAVIQIVVFHGEAFRLIRAANHSSFAFTHRAPNQFQIQVQHILTFQNKLEGQLLMYLFAVFTVLLNVTGDPEGIIPVAVAFGKLNFQIAVLGNLPEGTVTGCHRHARDLHIPGIFTGQGHRIFQSIVIQLGHIDRLVHRAGGAAGDGVGVISVLIPGQDCRQIQFQLIAAFFTLVTIIIALVLFAVIRVGRFCFFGLGFLRLCFFRFGLFGFRFLGRLCFFGRFGFFGRLGFFRFCRLYAILIRNHDVVQFLHIVTDLQDGDLPDGFVFQRIIRVGVGHVHSRQHQSQQHRRA